MSSSLINRFYTCCTTKTIKIEAFLPVFRATKLPFEIIEGRPDAARCQMLLSNIGAQPLSWHLRADEQAHISALPSGHGHIASRASTRCMLTWRKSPEITSWDKMTPPKIMLITRLIDNNNANEINYTRLLAQISDTKKTCESTKPPTIQLLLDASTNPSASDTSRIIQASNEDRMDEAGITASMETRAIQEMVILCRAQPWQNWAIFVLILLLIVSIISKS
ncbi:hypothetical protein AB6A40_002132 [Gnathostoma spinigerum]|uniref:Uncharacterized protein n=1 Tax=Gnathostoma spinigerum TaxID=75299 RepID=A0ABD6E5Y7_9BILA